jgi:hypothetical protein
LIINAILWHASGAFVNEYRQVVSGESCGRLKSENATQKIRKPGIKTDLKPFRFCLIRLFGLDLRLIDVEVISRKRQLTTDALDEHG